MTGKVLTEKRKPLFRRVWQNRALYLMLMMPLTVLILFRYVPMYGIQIAFKDYMPSDRISESPWVGLRFISRFISNYKFLTIMKNTLVLGAYGIATVPCALLLALSVHYLTSSVFRKLVQTISYLPHFLSIVIIAGIIRSLLSTDGGLFNTIIVLFGGQPIYFLGAPQYFRTIYVVSGVWQSIGWNTIIYLAAIAGVDGSLYEAAELDGAGVFRKMWHVTLPGILPVISLQLILNVGNLLNVGYEKVLLLYNDAILETADVIGTYVYREGLQNQSYSYSTAVGLFTSVLAMVMVLGSNAICKRLGQEGIW